MGDRITEVFFPTGMSTAILPLGFERKGKSRAPERTMMMTMSLQLINYSSIKGVLYCKPHFDQLFKRTGSLDRTFEGTREVDKASNGREERSSRVSSMFAGTQEKCAACKKVVYLIEKVAVDGASYHKSCFKCTHGGCVISPSNFVAHEQRLYCKHHHSKLFREKGNFSQLDKLQCAEGCLKSQ